jgi:hypothetical protein
MDHILNQMNQFGQEKILYESEGKSNNGPSPSQKKKKKKCKWKKIINIEFDDSTKASKFCFNVKSHKCAHCLK